MENGEALCTEYGTKNEKEQIVGFVMHLSMLSPRGGGGVSGIGVIGGLWPYFPTPTSGIALMQVFPKAIVFTTKPHIDAIRSLYTN